MSSILQERSQQWQGVNGPAQWAAAWERTRDLLGPYLPDGEFSHKDGYQDTIWADTACGLATALYIVARERNIPVTDVRRQDVEELTRPQAGEKRPEIPRRWETRLTRLGHDLEDSADPVVARWHVLRIDRPEPWHDEDYGVTRQGPGLLEGMDYVLSPRWDLQF